MEEKRKNFELKISMYNRMYIVSTQHSMHAVAIYMPYNVVLKTKKAILCLVGSGSHYMAYILPQCLPFIFESKCIFQSITD